MSRGREAFDEQRKRNARMSRGREETRCSSERGREEREPKICQLKGVNPPIKTTDSHPKAPAKHPTANPKGAADKDAEMEEHFRVMRILEKQERESGTSLGALGATQISVRGVSSAGVGSGDEADVLGDDEEECIVSSVLSGGVGESEYIVASESSSSVSFYSSDTWIGEDGVDDSFLRILEDFLLPVVLGAHIQNQSIIVDGLGRSFTEIIMDKNNSSLSCDNGYERPIGQIGIRASQSIFHMVQDDEGQIWFPPFQSTPH
ncbi:uncharacterized protein G2W53_026645 [Senna tora]|uniref:Uncharacterized protein n=1 Tax=Senna tora TaxID=362788 RepID=A0A834TG17_9FABA|nr:uncharacterized protein G2W53_026645 [Senna tora]